MKTSPLQALESRIIACERCPRLRSYCQGLAANPPARHRRETYWARPVPSFGPEDARLLIIGLAPAAHGSNRTGRMFTGDVDPRSWLMEALHATGFATLPTSRSPDDGLELIDARITAAVRCAPPDNKPTSEEIATCNPYLGEVIRLMPKLRVIVSLGGVALKALHTATQAREPWAFAHGAEHALPNGTPLLVSYHPSQQNTRTGRLQWAAWLAIWQRARAILDAA